MKIYRVGGYVRDKLLGLPAADCDYVVVGSSIDEMIANGFTQVGRHFPVFLHPQTKEEYALARTERKNGVGHCGFTVNSSPEVTLEEDLLRRDLTINAIAEDMTGKLIDPYGGIKDLKSKTLRHVSDAFSEDPLRILRVARFAAHLGFNVAKETKLLLQEMAMSQEGLTISRERVWAELDKAMSANHPSRFFRVLEETRNLEVFFPELSRIINKEKTLDQFCHEVDLDSSKIYHYLVLAIYLSACPTIFDELTNSNHLMNILKTASSLHRLITEKLESTKILELFRQNNALRDPQKFNITSEAYIKWLKLTNQNKKIATISLIIESLSELKKIPYKEITHQINNAQNIPEIIHNYQIDVISKVIS